MSAGWGGRGDIADVDGIGTERIEQIVPNITAESTRPKFAESMGCKPWYKRAIVVRCLISRIPAECFVNEESDGLQ